MKFHHDLRLPHGRSRNSLLLGSLSFGLINSAPPDLLRFRFSLSPCVSIRSHSNNDKYRRYGSKHPTDECPEAVFVICIQSMTGVILQAFMVGIVFAKLSRPKKRTQTLLFSRNAVICQRDGQPCLMFRVGDMRKSHIIEAHVRAQMIKRKVSFYFLRVERAKRRRYVTPVCPFLFF